MEVLLEKNLLHKKLYNKLSEEYKKRALDVLVQNDLLSKAKMLKSCCKQNGKSNSALEIGVGGGHMNKLLKDVGFETTGIDIAEKMIENAKSLNPSGNFIVGDYLETQMKNNYDAIVGLAFIHLFDKEEAKLILEKSYNDLRKEGILHLTTTLESRYCYDMFEKNDYGKGFQRYRAKHTPESFTGLISDLPFHIENFDIEKAKDGKQRMSLTARKE